MRRKFLKNTALTLCHIFGGWQLLNDYEALTCLGSGKLDIDVLRGNCQHNGSGIKQLSITKALRGYLNEDIARHHVPLETIQEARLTVHLQLDRHEGQRDMNHGWARPTRYFVGCILVAHSQVRTDKATYSAEYRREMEWPAPREK